jgi:hypothetical protein
MMMRATGNKTISIRNSSQSNISLTTTKWTLLNIPNLKPIMLNKKTQSDISDFTEGYLFRREGGDGNNCKTFIPRHRPLRHHSDEGLPPLTTTREKPESIKGCGSMLRKAMFNPAASTPS